MRRTVLRVFSELLVSIAPEAAAVTGPEWLAVGKAQGTRSGAVTLDPQMGQRGAERRRRTTLLVGTDGGVRPVSGMAGEEEISVCGGLKLENGDTPFLSERRVIHAALSIQNLSWRADVRVRGSVCWNIVVGIAAYHCHDSVVDTRPTIATSPSALIEERSGLREPRLGCQETNCHGQ